MTSPGDGRTRERAPTTQGDDTAAAARAVWPQALQRAAAAGLVSYGTVRTLTVLAARIGPAGRGQVRVADLIGDAHRARRTVQGDLRAAVAAGLLARSGGGAGPRDYVTWTARLPDAGVGAGFGKSGPAVAPAVPGAVAVTFRQVVRFEPYAPEPTAPSPYRSPRLRGPSRRWAGRR